MLCAKSLQSCMILCDPKNHSPPGSSVRGILQARILENFLLQGISPHPGIKLASLTSPELAGGFFTTSDTWEAQPSCPLTPKNYTHPLSCLKGWEFPRP